MSSNDDVRSLVSPVFFRRHRGLYFTALTVLIVLFSLIFLFPLYWMITGALKDNQEIFSPQPTIIPQSFHPETYLTAWKNLRIGHYFLNTLYYSVGVWFFQVLIDVTAAYALSRLRPVLGKLVLAGMLATLMLPMTALLVPAYLTVTDVPILGWNLINTPWALWLPGAANAFNIYVLKRFFDQIPQDILDAAAMDGAGKFRMLWSVVLPLSRPVLAVISILSIIGAWKDYLWPLLVLQDPEVQNLSVALTRLAATSGVVPFTQLLAGLVIASIPMILVFLVFQRSILRGLSAGSMKG
ncbi:sugar ABC transporter permease [Rhizocola hellebori]|uniref:Sugar ABC transporter permease n=1 Tax=Rhizocola hellebori TaxID=1392758 RepID=A0A8J3VG29_9ACTN|nr:carbohydrate ABC transporter permease [Rhizocola hellebori]GIH04661.1 sugar ABC transporter permease [Rhizocola hellebori]